jgi:hypothetical protein
MITSSDLDDLRNTADIYRAAGLSNVGVEDAITYVLALMECFSEYTD